MQVIGGSGPPVVVLIRDSARDYPGSGGGGMAEKLEDLLAQARALLPCRPSPAEALEAQAKGALLIDIRGDDQRRADGLCWARISAAIAPILVLT
jgi:hypothetical protein